MCVIHCRNGCTDMLYYCVIFVILNKKKKKKKFCSNRTAEGMQWHFFCVVSNFNIFEEQNAEEEQELSLPMWNSA